MLDELSENDLGARSVGVLDRPCSGRPVFESAASDSKRKPWKRENSSLYSPFCHRRWPEIYRPSCVRFGRLTQRTVCIPVGSPGAAMVAELSGSHSSSSDCLEAHGHGEVWGDEPR